MLVYQSLVVITRAAITPGIQPQQVRMNTRSNEPQPLSMTARGGNMMQRMTLQSDIGFFYLLDVEKVERFQFNDPLITVFHSIPYRHELFDGEVAANRKFYVGGVRGSPRINLAFLQGSHNVAGVR